MDSKQRDLTLVRAFLLMAKLTMTRVPPYGYRPTDVLQRTSATRLDYFHLSLYFYRSTLSVW